MIQIQVVPREGVDAYALLRSKVLHEATTWDWVNKKKTRLKHIQSNGHIDVSHAGGVVVAQVEPKDRRDLFYLAEKFMGRLVAWFENELAAINVQFHLDPEGKRPKRKKPASRAGRGQARSRKRARRAKSRR
jgi:hypothetical protein